MKTLAEHISKVAGDMVALPAATCCCGSSSSSKVAVGEAEVEAALQAATAITRPKKRGIEPKSTAPTACFGGLGSTVDQLGMVYLLLHRPIMLLSQPLLTLGTLNCISKE
jgi:hypothetical protein